MENAERRNGEWREELFDALPGGQIIKQGVADLQRGAQTVPALLVQIAGPRLRHLKLPIPHPPVGSFPEHELYDLLSLQDPHSAHSRYNALLRLLVSFERAAECATR